MLPLSDRSTVNGDSVQTLPTVPFQTISVICGMLNIDVMVPDVMISDAPSVLVVSQCGRVHPKMVYANVFVSPGIASWSAGEDTI